MRNFDSSVYQHMQAAVDMAHESMHPTNKIAATIAGDDFSFSTTNHWPPSIADTIGTQTKIGNASGTIHAETAAIFAANNAGHATKNASLFVTDPPCPNCVKNMAEAGIAKLYIDHKGFDKDWSQRNKDSFENMSMRIASESGMDVIVIYRKKERFEVISQHSPKHKPVNKNSGIKNPHCEALIATEQSNPNVKDFWIASLSLAMKDFQETPFALALANNQEGQDISVITHPHPAIEYEGKEDTQSKYSFTLQPLNRLLMIAAREGLKLNSDYIYSSRVPTARELVDFIGAGFHTIHIGDQAKARDEHGLSALSELEKQGVLDVRLNSYDTNPSQKASLHHSPDME